MLIAHLIASLRYLQYWCCCMSLNLYYRYLTLSFKLYLWDYLSIQKWSFRLVNISIKPNVDINLTLHNNHQFNITRKHWHMQIVTLKLFMSLVQNRTTHKCGADMFECLSTTLCVPDTFRCDDENDCGDNSDEENCGNKTPDTINCKHTILQKKLLSLLLLANPLIFLFLFWILIQGGWFWYKALLWILQNMRSIYCIFRSMCSKHVHMCKWRLRTGDVEMWLRGGLRRWFGRRLR